MTARLPSRVTWATPPTYIRQVQADEGPLGDPNFFGKVAARHEHYRRPATKWGDDFRGAGLCLAGDGINVCHCERLLPKSERLPS